MLVTDIGVGTHCVGDKLRYWSFQHPGTVTNINVVHKFCSVIKWRMFIWLSELNVGEQGILVFITCGVLSTFIGSSLTGTRWLLGNLA